MAKAMVDGVQSVDLGVPDLKASAEFYTKVWRLIPAAEAPNSVYLRGTGPYHHILGLHARPRAELLRVTLSAPDRNAVDGAHAALRAAGVAEIEAADFVHEPGGGYGFSFRDPEGRNLRILAGDMRSTAPAFEPDRPYKITHVVLNSRARDRIADFYCSALGFRLIDKTKMLSFLCCNADHHSIALAEVDAVTLNHVAFEMDEIDSVMRGAGRMRDHGYPLAWGVGRHGPADNVFAYFVGPDQAVIEYTAEIEQVDGAYQFRGPDQWGWPPGRTDQWGIAVGPSPELKDAQRRLAFPDRIFHPDRTG
jgi:catechol 2,3-dioxygenase